jgi:7-carboxy-7-deazaguanine synthase
LEKILEKVRHPYPHHVLVTGGEPLIQSETPRLLQALLKQGHKVYIETNGSLDIRPLDPRVVKVMDVKCPSSGESQKNLFQNIRHLNPQDEVKFVICDQTDFIWAKKILKTHKIQKYTAVLFSPAVPHLDPKLLAKWILEEKLEVRFQMQLHRILWGEKRGI